MQIGHQDLMGRGTLGEIKRSEKEPRGGAASTPSPIRRALATITTPAKSSSHPPTVKPTRLPISYLQTDSRDHTAQCPNLRGQRPIEQCQETCHLSGLTRRHAQKHTRHTSDSRVARVPPPARRSIPHVRSTSFSSATIPGPAVPEKDRNFVFSQRGIWLGNDIGVSEALQTVYNLAPSFHRYDAAKGELQISAFVAPLAHVLEALVAERTVLRLEDDSAPPLPPLRDGMRLQLEYETGGPGRELDWSATSNYVARVGTAIDAILPYLAGHGDREAVERATRAARAYVRKVKKVFGEVAGMYVGSYGFLRGWWNERYIKSAAGEIGRWGDVFDV